LSSVSSQPDVWTTRRLLDWIRGALERAQIDSPRLCAELLVGHVLDCARLDLYTHADRPATTQEREQLRTLVGRALQHEPVQYLTSTAWFFSLPFFVDKRVLIPRPSTETLVQAALEHARTLPEAPLLADVGTGSGCVAVSLLTNLPEARAIGTEIDASALEVAKQNAITHGVESRIEFVEGESLAPLRDRAPLDILVSNPPYIPDSEWDDVADNVKLHEPTHALRGGAEGLDVIAQIVESAYGVLKPGGMVGLEVAAVHAQRVCQMLSASGQFDDCCVLQDTDGLDRVVMAIRSA
jgi:release factor glutamine methyltransferase